MESSGLSKNDVAYRRGIRWGTVLYFRPGFPMNGILDMYAEEWGKEAYFSFLDGLDVGETGRHRLRWRLTDKQMDELQQQLNEQQENDDERYKHDVRTT